jgi:hypothetical protein
MDMNTVHVKIDFSQIPSTDAGRSIDATPLSEQAEDSIRDNVESDSNKIDVRKRQFAKHPSQIISITVGI